MSSHLELRSSGTSHIPETKSFPPSAGYTSTYPHTHCAPGPPAFLLVLVCTLDIPPTNSNASATMMLHGGQMHARNNTATNETKKSARATNKQAARMAKGQMKAPHCEIGGCRLSQNNVLTARNVGSMLPMQSSTCSRMVTFASLALNNCNSFGHRGRYCFMGWISRGCGTETP